jgi:hypothetical protein
MELGFLTLGAEVHIICCPGCPALSNGMYGAARMEMCSGSSSAKDGSWGGGVGA